MRKFIATIFLFSATLAVAPSEAACARNEYGVYEEIDCASSAYIAANKQLNEVYKALLGKLNDGEKRKLRDAQKAWILYKEKSEEFAFVIEGDGVDGRLVVVNQSERLTRSRITKLRQWIH
jgi:uncharacterized protein YecT (DUF1311 family)